MPQFGASLTVINCTPKVINYAPRVINYANRVRDSTQRLVFQPFTNIRLGQGTLTEGEGSV